MKEASQPVSSEERDRPHRLCEWLSDPSLLEPPRALVPGFVLAGRVHLLAGREKSGKSTFTAQAVAALSVGVPFLGEPLVQTPVLWYCLDEPIADCVRRFQMMGAGPEHVIISTERPTARHMRDEAQEYGAQLIVVDTLSELWRGHIKTENDADEVTGFLNPYIRAVRELESALVLLHHTPKSGREYRGSGAIGAKVDVLLNMRRPGQGVDPASGEEEMETDDGRRIFEGRGRGVPHFVQRFSFAGGIYIVGEKALPLRERILCVVLDGGASTRVIRAAVGGRAQAVTEVLNSLEAEGTIKREGQLWLVQ